VRLKHPLMPFYLGEVTSLLHIYITTGLFYAFKRRKQLSTLSYEGPNRLGARISL
jgi:hypothetical protein